MSRCDLLMGVLGEDASSLKMSRQWRFGKDISEDTLSSSRARTRPSKDASSDDKAPQNGLLETR